MNSSNSSLRPADALFPAIQKLDLLLGAALRKAEEIYGQQAAADPYRGLYISEEEAAQLLNRSPGAPLFAGERPRSEGGMGDRLDQLAADFGLQPFDLDLLVVALAPELDLRYERLYAYLQDDVTRKRPSVDLALNLLCGSAAEKIERRANLSPESPLRRQGLMHLIADAGQLAPPLLSCCLKLDDQLVKFLLGQSGLDARIAGFCEMRESSAELDELLLPADLKGGLARMLRAAAETNAPCKVYLHGPAGVGKRTLAEALAREANKPLLAADLAKFRGPAGEFDAALDLVFRDARFLNAILYLDGLDTLGSDDLRLPFQAVATRIRAFPGIVFAGGSGTWAEQGRTDSGMLQVELARPDFSTRRQLWERALAAEGWELEDAELIGLANRYLFTPRQIEKTVATARKQRTLRASTNTKSSDSPIEDLISGARAESSLSLGNLAIRVVPKATWAQIVLPQDQKTQLLEICNQAERRYRVYGEWGFEEKLSTGKGLNVLFSGPPGTGKTMAAEVIATRLRLDLHKIDLSQIVSKYIGETEKNVSRVFQEARTSNCILFFDEADALFGRRSEVRDAHDRYANVEVAFLLQQMEDYEGVSILATNLKQNIDEAFLRRLAFTLEFPFPDEGSRRNIWEFAWPEGMPLDRDIDFGHLARQFRFSGGSIKNTVVGAAFLGARKGSVGMVDLLMAARRESEKMGKAPARQDYGSWWEAMQERIAADWAEAQSS